MFFDVVLDALIATKDFSLALELQNALSPNVWISPMSKQSWSKTTVCPADLGPVVLLRFRPFWKENSWTSKARYFFFFWNATSYLTQPRNARWETIWSSWWAISWEMFVRSVSSSAWVAVAAFLRSFNVWGVDHWIKHHNINRYIMYTPLLGNSLR